MPPRPPGRPTWDLFCRVIDNHGDLGVAWRLATRLVALGATVRLWVDEAGALAWMAPEGLPGVVLRPWAEAEADAAAPGEVVVEAFGCDPPPAFVARMAARAQAWRQARGLDPGQPAPGDQHPRGAVPAGPGGAEAPAPLWLNLEYLSAEAWGERSHGLRSPQLGGPGRGLDKWFAYPGFSPATGGLLRGPLPEDGPGFDGPAWLAGRGLAPRPAAARVSAFGYPQPALPRLLEAWAGGGRPVDLHLAPGPATAQASAWLGHDLAPGGEAARADRGALRLHALPWLAQADYDRLLAACDLNLVRGEDSLVRALWAGRPFLWQLYRQEDGAHHRKLQAFLERVLLPAGEAAPGGAAETDAAIARDWAAWNGLAPPEGLDGGPSARLDGPAWAAWRRRAEALRTAQDRRVTAGGDLAECLWAWAHGPHPAGAAGRPPAPASAAGDRRLG